MRDGDVSVLQHLSKLLRVEHAAMVNEPLPERWVELINFLNEKERSRTQDFGSMPKHGSRPQRP